MRARIFSRRPGSSASEARRSVNIVGAMLTVGAILCVLGVILSSAVWAVASTSGNVQLVSRAKTGTVGAASGAITATLDHPAGPGGMAVTVSVATITGVFAPATVTIASGQSSGTFTFTPATAGTGIITASGAGLASGTLSFRECLNYPWPLHSILLAQFRCR